MAESPPTPRQTLALLLGASEYPHAVGLAHGRSFSNSAKDFREYFLPGTSLGFSTIAARPLTSCSRSGASLNARLPN